MSLLNKIIKKFPYYKEKKCLVLLYHHIGEPVADPWEMAVSLQHFRDHLDVLANDYQVLPLSSIRQQNKLSSHRTPVYITFDDAYSDNYTTAFPALREYQAPATFFIPTQVLTGEPGFWWEAVEDEKITARIRDNGDCPEAVTVDAAAPLHEKPAGLPAH